MFFSNSDLKAKARRWDEKLMNELKHNKDKLNDKYRELTKKKRKESDLNALRTQIRGSESRLRYVLSDRDSTVNLFHHC